MIGTATKPKPGENRSAEHADERLGTVVAASTALGGDANGSPRKLRFVPHREQVLRTQPVLLEQLTNRDAAQVHVSLRLGEDNFLPPYFAADRERTRLN